ncbi:MAG: hypothetical protein OHK0039_17630 [Bacteroidia bacterium]
MYNTALRRLAGLVLGAWVLTRAVVAQTCATITPQMVERLKADVYFLAADSLAGREAGTEGEALARDYISAQFEALGLKPMGDKGSYIQAFPFYAPVLVNPSTQLHLRGEVLALGKDFYPLSTSVNGRVQEAPLVDVGFGIEAPELDYSDYTEGADYAGKVFVMNYSSPDGVHPHSKYLAYHDLEVRVRRAAIKGAAAVILHNPDKRLPHPPADFTRITGRQIPVVFVQPGADTLLRELELLDYLDVQMEEQVRTGYNVAAYLDRGSEQTVVIGAHYDHLGMGGEGSRHTGGEAVHNGADDNASGTAALLELARYFADYKDGGGYNLLFLAFSAEEKGLLGSKFFVNNSSLPFKHINYMVNMDMVGRLDRNKALVINGAGTSPRWEPLLKEIVCYGISPKTTASGVGPSDHTSFYLKDIPVLHFFTGTHSDYHKPEDDADRVNYEGLAEVTAYIATLVEALDGEEKLAFTKTQDDSNQPRPRFSVTLGVMPDYTFQGTGMRIDAVSEGKPAQAAGIKGGDVLTQIGELPIRDMSSYMQALSMFQKGDKVKVILLRDGKSKTVDVTF